MQWFKHKGLGALALLLGATLAFPDPVKALDKLEFTVTGADKNVESALRGASLLLAAQAEGTNNPQDLLASARAEYGRLVGALYAMGRYSGVVTIRVDGREAADIPPLDAPNAIGTISLSVDPGPVFTFSKASITPLAADTKLPEGFRIGAAAQSDMISAAASAAVDGWRNAGHAKADVIGQDLTADHKANTLAASLTVSAGPRLRFGELRVSGQERMRLNRVIKIAGLPSGEQYSPKEMEDAAERLRRTGVFSSVALVEDDKITAPDVLGISLKVAEEKLRRYSYGAEIGSSEGAKLTGYWLHRNLFGGGERFKVEGEVAQIGAQDSGVDYALGFNIDRPATLSPDTTGTAFLKFGHEDEADYVSDYVETGIGFTHYWSREITARVGLEYAQSRVQYTSTTENYSNLALPVGVNWDKRNSKTDATQGFYIDAEAAPFLGFGTTDSGFKLEVDARAYRGFGENDRVTFAARLQAKGVFGSSINNLPPAALYYSGGGGSVRGQAYQSLGFTSTVTGDTTGGTGFLGASFEVRAKVTKSIGVVGFADFGQISNDGMFGGDTLSHASAGFGLRYATGFGPIRLDVGVPVSGGGTGAQVYVGIGQSF
jgi:translocation and assembly module TamA